MEGLVGLGKPTYNMHVCTCALYDDISSREPVRCVKKLGGPSADAQRWSLEYSLGGQVARSEVLLCLSFVDYSYCIVVTV